MQSSRFTFVLFALALSSSACKQSNESKPSGTIVACYSSSRDTCIRASGSNHTRMDRCDGQIMDSCPQAGFVGKCVNNEGKKTEASIFYYERSVEDAREMCQTEQKIYGGVFYTNF